jgi:hypothetical protein
MIEELVEVVVEVEEGEGVVVVLVEVPVVGGLVVPTAKVLPVVIEAGALMQNRVSLIIAHDLVVAEAEVVGLMTLLVAVSAVAV